MVSNKILPVSFLLYVVNEGTSDAMRIDSPQWLVLLAARFGGGIQKLPLAVRRRESERLVDIGEPGALERGLLGETVDPHDPAVRRAHKGRRDRRINLAAKSEGLAGALQSGA